MDLSVEPIDIASAPEADLRALHALEQLAIDERYPNDPPYPYEEYLADVRYEPDFVRHLRWVIRDRRDDLLLGSCSLRLRDKEENRNKARVYAYVHPKARRRGLGSALMKAAAEGAAGDSRSVLESWVPMKTSGPNFAESIGFEMCQLERMSRCYVRDVDRAMLEDWVTRAKERASDYTLRIWDGPCPEEIINEFAAGQAVMNTAPQGERTHEWEETTPEELREAERSLFDAGFSVSKAAVFAPDGNVAGYTEVYYGDFRPQIGWQGDTGVWPDHRNRGLGRWLKAAMFLHLVETRPKLEFVETGNAATNESMLNINHAMGFRLAEEIGSYEASVERLAERLT